MIEGSCCSQTRCMQRQEVLRLERNAASAHDIVREPGVS